MCHIYNMGGHQPIPRNAVYVGRGSPFGNPFKIGRDGNRLRVIQRFETWIKAQPELMARVAGELKGKDLVCHCAPSYCHAEILYEIANEHEYPVN